jgi:hypothetical protein
MIAPPTAAGESRAFSEQSGLFVKLVPRRRRGYRIQAAFIMKVPTTQVNKPHMGGQHG